MPETKVGTVVFSSGGSCNTLYLNAFAAFDLCCLELMVLFTRAVFDDEAP